jgi:WD40 repeat protein
LFDTDTGSQIQEVRRGSDHADVYCISFDPISRYLACSSDKGTIHIFSIRADVHLSAQSKRDLGDLNAANEDDIDA